MIFYFGNNVTIEGYSAVHEGNTDNYVPKWFTGTAITGTGASISAVIANSKAGDMYLNTSTDNVYKSSSVNVWDYVCNIKGAKGDKGDKGDKGATGSQGPQGPAVSNVSFSGVTGVSFKSEIISGAYYYVLRFQDNSNWGEIAIMITNGSPKCMCRTSYYGWTAI